MKTHPTPPTRAEVEAGAKAAARAIIPICYCGMPFNELNPRIQDRYRQLSRAVLRAAAKVKGK